MALADCTYVWKTGSPFPLETAFMFVRRSVKYMYVAVDCSEACSTERLVEE